LSNKFVGGGGLHGICLIVAQTGNNLLVG